MIRSTPYSSDRARRAPDSLPSREELHYAVLIPLEHPHSLSLCEEMVSRVSPASLFKGTISRCSSREKEKAGSPSCPLSVLLVCVTREAEIEE